MLSIISQKERKIHVKHGDSYYLISQSLYNPKEILIFNTNKNGDFFGSEEVGSASSMEEALENFKDCLHSWKF
jgi:hypothetical protein